MWKLHFTKQAQKDAKRLAAAGLKGKTQSLLDIIKKIHCKTHRI